MMYTRSAHREGAVAARNSVRGNRETLDLRSYRAALTGPETVPSD